MVKIRDICDYVAFALLVLGELFLFYRLKLKVDSAGIVTLAIFTFILFLRVLDGLIYESNSAAFLILVSVA